MILVGAPAYEQSDKNSVPSSVIFFNCLWFVHTVIKGISDNLWNFPVLSWK